MKVFFLVGFYCATAFAAVIGQTGDWDILSAALAVVVVEGIGALMYKGSFPLLNKIRSLITLFNYWKAGLSLGLFLDSFKYEMDNIIGSNGMRRRCGRSWDSLNRGQWISMVCLLQSVIPENKRSMTPNAQLTVFRAEEYNATVEFLWAPLLVESNSDDPMNHRLDEWIIRLDSVQKYGKESLIQVVLIF
ncbi:hypothetical protein EZV62_008535 [Acer yangbiense]|uniref:Trichome birefringence-like C-terminal domain-containing protein n=1 Tax=Acer yangbiense TaxID=1000413 RepID=A0A5C7ID15_9ROSI|nr:hypothetical protein EZV62_008535 [Acer yangbiense]